MKWKVEPDIWLTLYPYRTTHALDEVFADGEAQTGAAVARV